MYCIVSVRSTLKTILIPCVILITIASCKKGDPGTANVIFSEWFKPDYYKKDTVFGIWGFNYDKPVSQITRKLLDSGTVVIYGKLRGYNVKIWDTSQVAPLPISLTYVSGTTMTDTWSGLATPGKLRIRFVNDKNYWTAISTEHLFRYIIIPGAVKATGATSDRRIVTRSGRTLGVNELNDIEHMSYKDVCAKLDIPE